MIPFHLLPDWVKFDLDGTTYMKLRKGYDEDGAVVNALRLSDNRKVFITRLTKITPAEEYRQGIQPIVCQPVLRRL